MPTISLEIDEVQQQPVRSLRRTVLPAKARIGSGIALASWGCAGRWKDNPHHWQTLVFLLPLRHNPDHRGHRKPVSKILIQRTISEMRKMFSGYTLMRAKGWYWDADTMMGVPDDLMRFEVDGIFTGSDIWALSEWKKKLLRRFDQKYIYMKVVESGVAI